MSRNYAVETLDGCPAPKEAIITNINDWLGRGGEKMVADGIASGEIEEGKNGIIGLKGQLGSLAKDDRIEKALPAHVKSAPETAKKRRMTRRIRTP